MLRAFPDEPVNEDFSKVFGMLAYNPIFEKQTQVPGLKSNSFKSPADAGFCSRTLFTIFARISCRTSAVLCAVSGPNTRLTLEGCQCLHKNPKQQQNTVVKNRSGVGIKM